jgi:hypothetical protein
MPKNASDNLEKYAPSAVSSFLALFPRGDDLSSISSAQILTFSLHHHWSPLRGMFSHCFGSTIQNSQRHQRNVRKQAAGRCQLLVVAVIAVRCRSSWCRSLRTLRLVPKQSSAMSHFQVEVALRWLNLSQ